MLAERLGDTTVGMVAPVSILGWYGSSARNERNELLKVEWLYRLKRTQSPNKDFINHIEKDILHGNEKDLEEWKTIIIEQEDKAHEFLYFKPHEDWQPEQKGPEPEAPHKPKDTKSEKQAQLPHEKKSGLTPGEIEAIKAMRANPHIPEDAKPPLPEVY